MVSSKWKKIRSVVDEGLLKDKNIHAFLKAIIRGEEKRNNFIKKCLKKNKTRWMLNRLKWFIELADSQKYDSVKVFFLIAMAETNIKLLEDRFNDDSNEVVDVRKFFNDFSQQDKNELRRHFSKVNKSLNKESLKFDKVVEILLNVRHRLAHGKNHYDFQFHNGSDSLINIIFGEIGRKNRKKKIEYQLEITYKYFRKMMVRNVVENIKKAI
jgi:hypothetical protein